MRGFAVQGEAGRGRARNGLVLLITGYGKAWSGRERNGKDWQCMVYKQKEEKKMKTIEVTIEGLTPILMHRNPLMDIKGFDKLPPEEQAEYAAYRDKETNELFIPSMNIWRAFISGATYDKGKGRASKKKETAACLLIEPDKLFLGTDTYEIDTRAVRIPSTGGTVPRHRPKLNHWKIDFFISYDPELISAKEMREIVDNTCNRVGFLDFRPEKLGPFGKAMVTKWVQVKQIY